MENGEVETGISPVSSTLCDSPSVDSPPLEKLSSERSSQMVPESNAFNWITKVRKYLGLKWTEPILPIAEEDQQMSDIKVRKPSSCPRGFPRLAAFLDSDECFMIYRRFGFLQSRLILEKQDELRELEEQLDSLDKREEEKSIRHPMTRDPPRDIMRPRKELLSTIEEKFCSYANLLIAAQAMIAMHRPAKVDYTSVRTFMWNHTPIMQPEASWIDPEEDMITLRAGREHAWLDSCIERLLKCFHCSLLERLFGDDRSREKSSDSEKYYSRQQINRLANTIITMMILVLLIVPIYTLYHLIRDVHTDRAYAICMGILVVATLTFSAVLSLFTKAKRHEILASAAAYCAVLVVFLGNIGPGGPGKP